MSQTIDTKNRTIQELRNYFIAYFDKVPEIMILHNNSIFGSKEEQDRIFEIENLRMQRNLLPLGDYAAPLTLLYGSEFLEFLITANGTTNALMQGAFANLYINTLLSARGASLSIENNKSLIVVSDANLDKAKNIADRGYANSPASGGKAMPYYDSSTNNQSRLWDDQIWPLR